MNYPLASRIIHEMGLANDDRFDTTRTQRERLAGAVSRMQAAGVAFTDEEIFELVDGEETEREERFSPFDGFEVLDAVLNEVFDSDRDIDDEDMAICCHWPEVFDG